MEEKQLTAEDIIEKVFLAIGEASMSWDEIPKGVFDSTNAKRIGEELLEDIEQYHQSKVEAVTGLLKIVRCPEPNCDNNGTIAVQVSNNEWEPQQCQWCDERQLLTKKEE